MGKGRILVVEDEGVVALDLQHRLKSLGYDVPVTVPTGEEAVTESKRLKPDLILMDVRLKGAKDGVEAAEEIRGVTDVPVVFLTAYADEQTVARAKNAEPFGYIVKPFQEREISATIEIALFKHRIQRELRHRERWFSAILRGIGDAVIAADTNEKIAFINPVAEQLTGWRASEALGRNATEVFRIIDEPSGKPLENPISASLRNGRDARLPRNVLLVARHGGTTPIDDSAALIRDEHGNNWGVVLTFRDIAERRQHERRLLESEQRFRAIFDSVHDAVLVYGLGGGDTLDANLRACELLGHSRDEFRQLGVEAWGLGAPPYARADAMRWLQKVASGNPQSFEWRTYQPNGQPLLLEVSLKLARIGGEARILATMRDITQRRLLQDQVSRSQKLEAIGQLAGGVAHDFNNLLTVINGYTSLLLAQLKDDAEMTARAMQILSAGERAAALTRQLLTLARRQLVHLEQLDFNGLVTELSPMLRRTIREDIDFEFNTAKDALYVIGDRTQFEQVVLNLVFNARDAMPAGGRLTVETRDAVLDESSGEGLIPPGHYVTLTVRDTGTGMDEQTRSRLFEPFFTTKPPGQGTGLGLSTVYGIVKRSGGFILVDSQVNRGTTFTIYLPASPGRPQEQASEQKGTATSEGSEKILLVEDDAGVRNLVSDTLTGLGYSAIVARNAEEALELFTKHKDSIDLLLTDIVMPRMNGRDLAYHLQSQRPSLKVLFMSGYADSGLSRGGAVEAGSRLLRKPFTGEALGATVREVLDQ